MEIGREKIWLGESGRRIRKPMKSHNIHKRETYYVEQGTVCQFHWKNGGEFCRKEFLQYDVATGGV